MRSSTWSRSSKDSKYIKYGRHEILSRTVETTMNQQINAASSKNAPRRARCFNQ
jgi:hypothetical protein